MLGLLQSPYHLLAFQREQGGEGWGVAKKHFCMQIRMLFSVQSEQMMLSVVPYCAGFSSCSFFTKDFIIVTCRGGNSVSFLI